MIYIILFKHKHSPHWLMLCDDGEPLRFLSYTKATVMAEERLCGENILYWDVMSLDKAREFFRHESQTVATPSV